MKSSLKNTKKLKGGANNNPLAGILGNNNKGKNNTGSSGGNTASGNAPGGNSAAGNTPGGNSAAGNRPGGNSAAGNAPGGNTASRNNPGGNSASGNAPGGNTASGNAPGGNTASGNAPGGNKAAGNNQGANKLDGNNSPNNNTGANNRGLLNKAGNIASNTANTIQKKIGNVSNSLGNLNNLSSSVRGIGQLGNINKYLMILFIGIAFVGVLFLLRFLVIKYYNSVNRAPYLIKGTKTGKHSVIIHQDPNSINYIPIKRSENADGMEFSYSFWMLIMDVSYRPGQWKHIFHKGGSTSYPNRAPGVWLHPTKNSIRVYMNTFNNPLEYVDVDNIPVKKWVCVQVILQNINSHRDEPKDFVDKERNHVLDVYINGTVKKSKVLDSIPKQNNGDLWVNLFGGFDGYLSKLRYYNEALEYDEIQSIIKEGPSKIITTDTGELPPYLDDSWWEN